MLCCFLDELTKVDVPGVAAAAPSVPSALAAAYPLMIRHPSAKESPLVGAMRPFRIVAAVGAVNPAALNGSPAALNFLLTAMDEERVHLREGWPICIPSLCLHLCRAAYSAAGIDVAGLPRTLVNGSTRFGRIFTSHDPRRAPVAFQVVNILRSSDGEEGAPMFRQIAGPFLEGAPYPRAAVPSLRSRLQCWGCGSYWRPGKAFAELSRCQRCRVARYCSRGCQVGDWLAGGVHREACPGWKTLAATSPCGHVDSGLGDESDYFHSSLLKSEFFDDYPRAPALAARPWVRRLAETVEGAGLALADVVLLVQP
ncbi:hypothetical protein I4F81_011335 [Pyropia yezoensis]|uniref:Uncharacterized protein n=1 Tax=Pyropia yezoensis TaxID=2788 RepID=A0ACC3CFI9_PYRYE|nr:hypothetical protein I4F81_011335 [Neopyropia yezoensis]